MLGNFLADTMIKPHQSPLFDNPKNYGLDYEEVTFKASDGVSLSGWLIKGGKEKVIIQSHFGVQCCRSGYTTKGKGIMKGFDKEIHFLNQAKYLNEEGYTLLMYDFRNHGQSELGTNPWITWGEEEAKDVVAAVEYISNHEDYQNAHIGLFSICMGQGAATMAFGLENGLKKYSNLKAMISVQPLDYVTFINSMGMPKFLVKSANRVIEKRTGIDFTQNTWRPFVKDISVPTLVIQNKNDSFLDKDLIDEYCNNLQVEKEMLWIEIPKMKNATYNRLVAYDWIGKNSKEILHWFGKYI